MLDHRGQFLQGQELAEYAKKHGKCTICGETETHELKGRLLKKRVPKQEVYNAKNELVVYKGYCLQPTCYTLHSAKLELGEVRARTPHNHHHHHHHHSNHNRPSRQDPRLASPHQQLPLSPPYTSPIQPNTLQSTPGTTTTPGSSSARTQDARIQALTNPSSNNRPLMPNLTHNLMHQEGTNHLPGGSQPLRIGGGAMHDRSDRSSRGEDELLAAINGNGRAAAATVSSSSGGSDSWGGFHTADGSSTNYTQGGTAGGSNSSSRRPGSGRSSGGIRSGYHEEEKEAAMLPEQGLLRQMEDAVQYGDFTMLLSILGANETKVTVVKTAFRLLCKAVRAEHEKHDRMICVFVNDSWVKSLNTVINDHSGDEEIQELAAATYAVLSHVSKRYMLDIVKHGGAKLMLSTLEKYKDSSRGTVDTCCCALYCMVDRTVRFGQPAPRQTGLLLKHELGAKTVELLIASVGGASSEGKCWVLNSIVNFSIQGFPARNGKKLAELVRDSCRGQGISKLISATRSDTGHVGLAQSGLELLSRLSARDSNGISIVVVTEDLWRTIFSILSKQQDKTVHQKAYVLLSNLTIAPDFATTAMLTTFINSVTSSISEHTTNLGVQNAALLSLVTVLGSSENRKQLVECDGLAGAIVSTMNAHEPNLEIQSKGCLALATLASGNESCKLSIVSNGGVLAVSKALCHHVTNATTRQEDEDHEELRLYACTVFISLATSTLTSPALTDQAVVSSFMQAVQTGVGVLPEKVRTTILNVLTDGSDVDSPHQATSVAYTIESLMGASSKQEAETMMTTLSSLCRRSPKALDSLMATEGGHGIERLMGIMTRYIESLPIQEAGCDILADVFFKFPFRGQFGVRSHVEVGSTAFTVVPHTEDQIVAIRKAVTVFKTKVSLIPKAFTALSIFLAALATDERSRAAVDDGVRQRFSGLMKDAKDAISIHQDVLEIQICAMEMVRYAFLLGDKTELRLRGASFIEGVMISLSIHHENTEMKLNACLTLLSLIQEEEDDSAIGGIDGQRFASLMLCCMESDSEQVAEVSSELVATILPRVISLVGHFVDSPGSIDTIVGTILRHPGSAVVSGHCCSILVSIATLHENFVMPMIVHSGGVSAILGAINYHPTNNEVHDIACQALLNISRGIPGEVMSRMRENLAETMLRVLQQSMRDTDILASVLEILWYLCSRDEFFKEFFTENNAVPSVVESMNQNLHDRSVQGGGCASLWCLASFGDNKRVIGEAGGLRSIINALLAHLESVRIQKEGMTALKNLATTSRNKHLITTFGGIDAILISIRAGIKSEDVLSAAFSALNNIAVDTFSRMVADVPPEIIESILIAMRRHTFSEAVQKNACFLLKSYTFAANNLQMMQRQEAAFMAVLTLAADNFPAECGERAHYVIGRLL